MKLVEEHINERISLILNGKLVVFFAEDIEIIHGHQGGTKFFIDKKGEYLSSYHLGHYSALIEKCQLFQVHRSYFINLEKVYEYQIADETILMINKKTVPLAKSFKTKFIKIMRNFLDETMMVTLSFGVNLLSFG
jgi:DNA-binding LytR/AlgR family response regulator